MVNKQEKKYDIDIMHVVATILTKQNS